MIRNSLNKSNGSNEKTLAEIFHIIYTRKWIIIISIVSALTLAFLYNVIATPVYESTVILKKELANKKNLNNDLMEIVMMQTQDEVETEMELVKTVEVLSKVVEELNLIVHYDAIITPEGDFIELDNPELEYSNPSLDINIHSVPFPKVLSVQVKDYDQPAKYFISRDSDKIFRIYNESDSKLLQTITLDSNNISSTDSALSRSNKASDSLENINSSIISFHTDLAKIQLNCFDMPVNSKFYFTINSFNRTVEGLSKQVSISRTGKTNLFSVSVRSASPYSSAVIANLLIDKFRESRIEQQKQTIRYSFNFIDEQLRKMQLKLRESEENLSKFKESSQITTIDASSNEVVKFLSTLEAEKMDVELQLSEFQNKYDDMKKQMESSGYFDQNLLAPQTTGGGFNDPFANLLRQISDLELKKLELLQRRTENHPDVVSIDEQINLAKKKLASYNQNTLSAYQIFINSLDKKKNDISSLISKYESKLQLLPSQENKFARLFREKTVYEKMFTLLLDKREEMRMAELSKLQDIIVVDPARKPLKPVSPKKLFNLLITFVLGSFIGILAVFIVELKNSKLVSLDELDREFNYPVLSIIPRYTRAIKNNIDKAIDTREKFVNLMTEEHSGFNETYKLLRTKMELQFEGRKKIFMVTSCEENTGKSTIVGNLAISFAQKSKRILIIDCDLRKAGLSNLFDLQNEKDGLIGFLNDEIHPTIHTRVLKNIDILPTGGTTMNSSNILVADKFRELFSTIDTTVYDYIIIDTPPVTRVVDTLILGKFVKDTLLVVRPDLSLKENVKGGIQDLQDARIMVRGIIVNAAELNNSYYYKNRYGYGYGYGYGNGKNKSSSNKVSKNIIKFKKNISIN